MTISSFIVFLLFKVIIEYLFALFALLFCCSFEYCFGTLADFDVDISIPIRLFHKSIASLSKCKTLTSLAPSRLQQYKNNFVVIILTSLT